MKFGKLRGRIREKFKTQESFARAVNMGEGTVSKKLNGHSEWTREEMVAVCQALGIPLAEAHIYFF